MIETDISRAIVEAYHRRVAEHLENDVVIVGAGPAGLAAGYYLAKAGVKTTILEKRLSIGGGIWGGAAGYNIIVVEDTEILDEVGITAQKDKNLYLTDAIEFATGLAYRAKDIPDDRLFALAVEFVEICREMGAMSIINDRADIATAAGADGVHVGQNDLPVAQVRRLQLVPPIIGMSTHSPKELDGACPALPTYVSLGPVFPTPISVR